MSQLIDVFTDSLQAILNARPIEPELDSDGNPKSINWKLTLDNAKSGGPVATAEVLGWVYEVEVLKCRVSAKKVKEVPRTPEELVKSSAVVKKEDEQMPGFRQKAIDAVKPNAIKDNDTKFSEEKKPMSDSKKSDNQPEMEDLKSKTYETKKPTSFKK